MEFYTYLYPSEYIAQLVVKLQLAGFILWTTCLIYFFIRDLRIKKQIKNFNVMSLRKRKDNSLAAEKPILSTIEEKGSSELPDNVILNQHIMALSASGLNKKPVDVPGLVKNTTNRLTANNSWLRSTLSLFIILGLLGTLWGLASSLDQLSTLSPGATQITNETLAQGLKSLLGKLGGAFAPSICGVFFTIAGVIFFAIYFRAASIPLINSLERETLTYWAPLLVMQRTDESLMMQENIKAAQHIGRAAESISANIDKLVTTFNENLPALVKNLTESVSQITEKLSSDATELAGDVKKARGTLKSLTTASENLNMFSDTFKNSVEKLYPFSDATELRALYQELVGRSSTLIEQNEEFQQKVGRQLDELSGQKVLLTNAVTRFEEKVGAASSSMVAGSIESSNAAKEAFGRLSSQNEDLIRELVNQVGTPVAAALAPLPKTLGGIESEIRRINTPLEGIKNSIAETSFTAVNHANDHLRTLDEKLMAQVTNLKNLSDSFDNLVPKIEILSDRIDGFNSKTESIAGKLADFHLKADEVIKETRTAPKALTREPRASAPDPPKAPKGIFGKIKSIFFGE